MFTSRRWMLATVMVGLGMGVGGLRADEPKEDEPTGDLKAMQGAWVSEDDTGESTWTFEKNVLTLKTPDREYKIKVKLDEAAEPHKHIDLDVLEDSPNAKGFQAPGIYKLEGETLTICFGTDGVRPEKFEADFMTTFLFETKKKAE